MDMNTNTNPAPTRYTIRMVGRCAVRTCKRRVRVDVVQESTILAGSRLEGFDTRIEIITPGVSDHYGRRYIACPDCGASIRLQGIRLPHPDYRTKKCDGRCMGAVGPSCDCQCGGENHGANHIL